MPIQKALCDDKNCNVFSIYLGNTKLIKIFDINNTDFKLFSTFFFVLKILHSDQFLHRTLPFRSEFFTGKNLLKYNKYAVLKP